MDEELYLGKTLKQWRDADRDDTENTLLGVLDKDDEQLHEALVIVRSTPGLSERDGIRDSLYAIIKGSDDAAAKQAVEILVYSYGFFWFDLYSEIKGEPEEVQLRVVDAIAAIRDKNDAAEELLSKLSGAESADRVRQAARDASLDFRELWNRASKWQYDWKEDDRDNENQIRCYSDAIRAHPVTTGVDDAALADAQFAMAYCNRGICYREIGEVDLAKADFQRANELDSCDHYQKLFDSV